MQVLWVSWQVRYKGKTLVAHLAHRSVVENIPADTTNPPQLMADSNHLLTLVNHQPVFPDLLHILVKPHQAHIPC